MATQLGRTARAILSKRRKIMTDNSKVAREINEVGNNLMMIYDNDATGDIKLIVGEAISDLSKILKNIQEQNPAKEED